MRKRIIVIVLTCILLLFFFIVGYYFGQNGVTNIEGVLNSIVAIVGLVVAILAIILTHTTRIDQQRQALFDKQIIIFEELYPLILEYSKNIIRILKKVNISKDEAGTIIKMNSDIQKTINKYWILMPSKIILLFIRLESELKLCRKIISSEQRNEEEISKLLLRNTNTVSMIFNSFRLSMGIEQLHEDTIKLLGTKEEYEKDHVIFENAEEKK